MNASRVPVKTMEHAWTDKVRSHAPAHRRMPANYVN